MREIKVQLYRGEDDNYVELWKTVEEIEGKHRYYGSHLSIVVMKFRIMSA